MVARNQEPKHRGLCLREHELRMTFHCWWAKKMHARRLNDRFDCTAVEQALYAMIVRGIWRISSHGNCQGPSCLFLAEESKSNQIGITKNVQLKCCGWRYEANKWCHGKGQQLVGLDGSSEAKQCRECCSSSSSRSLVNMTGNISDVMSNVPTFFSENCSSVDVNHDGWFKPTTTMAKLIMWCPVSTATSFR